MNKFIVTLSSLLLVFTACGSNAADHDLKKLLRQLDRVVADKSVYIRQKEQSLTQRKELLRHTISDEQRYGIYDQLYTDYLHYSLDSAMVYAEKKMDLALKLNNREWITDTRMNMASIYEVTGLYMEALDEVSLIGRDQIADYKTGHYYHILHTGYRAMSEAAVSPVKKSEYLHLAETYRDSLLITIPSGDAWASIVNNETPDQPEAIRIRLDRLLEEENRAESDLRHSAILYYSIARAYTDLGQREEAKKYLALTAIEDLQVPVREYLALRDLAIMLYEDGDIKRAHDYIQCTLDDVTACNARTRMLSVSEVLPVINKAYEDNRLRKQKQLWLFLFSVTLLSLCLLAAVMVIGKQKRRIQAARAKLVEANENLLQLNAEMNRMNEQVKVYNNQLLESNSIKDEYLGQYMDLCTVYINKVDNYRKELLTVARNEGSEAVMKAIKFPHYLEEELRGFYNSFDETFLHLFPGFVEAVNLLLRPEERITLKPGRMMNTELRILALIRLGVTDSVKIARFLHCSVSTVYNYRTKLRNAALNSRGELEEKVISINPINI